MNPRLRLFALVTLATALGLAGCSSPAPAPTEPVLDVTALGRTPAAGQRTFATPEDAVAALHGAARAGDRAALSALFGPQLAELESGNAALDAAHLQRFAADLDLHREVLPVPSMPGVQALVFGPEGATFPVPLVHTTGAEPGGWFFDAAAGAAEIRLRRIGAGELRAMEVMTALVEAQRTYEAIDRDGDGVREYALLIASTPGQHDGLHWAVPEGPGPDGRFEPASPVGPHLAKAASDAGGATRTAYHGYFYRALPAQGPGAPGGAKGFVVNGHATGGFAFIAAPARYGESGVATFMVGPDGVLYEFDLGPDSAAIAEAITTYDPTGWRRVVASP